MDGVEPQCRIKKDDKAIKRKIVGWKMSLMVSRLPDRRHRHPIWIMSEGFYSPEGGGISLPDTVLGDLRCRNMRRWDSRCLGPSQPIIPWLDTSHARYVGIFFSVSLWCSPTHAGRLSFIESVWNRKKKKKRKKFNMQHELQTAHLISIFIYNSICLALRHCDTRISPPKIGHFSQFLIY